MKRKTILWADDDADDLILMKEVLQRNNKDYQIVEVGNGKEALEFLRRSKEAANLPCLVILDINMPVIDGKETLALIKKSEDFRDIPIVVFTTSSSELDKMFCRRYEVEMITKPPHYKSFETAVLKLLSFCSR